MRELAVVLEGRRAATIVESRDQQLRMSYDDDYRSRSEATPLSTSLPVQVREHGHEAVSSFLWGLLPDNDRVLDRWSRRFHVSASSPVALLATPVGHDCAGAVQFAAPDDLEDLLDRPGGIDWLTEADVVERLDGLAQDSTAWLGETTRSGQFSLAGAQSKIALRMDPATGRWGVPYGAEPTSHIVKPGVTGLDDQALNEHLCLATARHLGLLAARTQPADLGPHRVIVVDRFDRIPGEPGLRRVHQEDMCQAMGLHPSRKYQAEGGPDPTSVAKSLRSVMPYTEAEKAVRRFADALIFNWLIAGTDAHAKNYGLLLAGSQVRLAPLYDVASMLPYEADPLQLKLAMKIGREYRLKAIRARDVERTAESLGLDTGAIIDRALELAGEVPEAMADVCGRPEITQMRSELPARLLDRVAAWSTSCEGVLKRHVARGRLPGE